jgi:hypothetical protein
MYRSRVWRGVWVGSWLYLLSGVAHAQPISAPGDSGSDYDYDPAFAPSPGPAPAPQAEPAPSAAAASGVSPEAAATASPGEPAAAPPPSAAAPPPPSAAVPVDTVDNSWGQQRVLGGHSFQLGTFLPSALVSSYVGVRAGFEYHQVPGFTQLPTLLPSGPQAVDLRTVNVAETIDLAVRLVDFLSIFADGYGRARIGANINTLLGTGADYTYGGNLGMLLKLFRVASFQLSVRAQIGYYTGQSAGISALFQDLNAIAQGSIRQVQNNPLDFNNALNQLNVAFITATADLLTPFSGVTYGASANFALALGRFVGLQAAAGFYMDYATYRPTHYDIASNGPVSVEHTVLTTQPTFGAALDFDAEPIGLPVAIMLEYRGRAVNVNDKGRNIPPVDTSSLEHLIALGIYYSGRTDLQLGLTGYTVFGQVPSYGVNAIPSGKPLDLAAQLVFRYFW